MGLALGMGANGVFVIGSTNDTAYGGDMSNDVAGLGVALSPVTSSEKHFALAVYADDAGATPASDGWCSAIFGSMVQYGAITGVGGDNISYFGVAGQMHLGAQTGNIGNMAGVYGTIEVDSAVTITTQICGILAGVNIASATTDSSIAGVQIGGSITGTTNGLDVAIYIQNLTSTEQWDAAFRFGQDSAHSYAGCGDATAAASEDIFGHLKVYMGTTLCYINLYSDAT